MSMAPASFLLALILSAHAAAQQPAPPLRLSHRVANERTVVSIEGLSSGATGATGASASTACATVEPHAWHGQPVPGGGTLSPLAFSNPATMGADGRVAFFSVVDGAARNQGIFTADSAGLHAIAMGCGGGGGSGVPGGGCGDPTPIGGTFSGMFGGTFFAPSINATGDVLFLADVDGGSAPRGLFLHQATSGAIVRVAAVGDPSPVGGNFNAVGPGSLSPDGCVAFVARSGAATTGGDIFLWEAGTVSKVVAVSDPAPGGGVFNLIATETVGFVDGSSMPVGPIPSINARGQIAFRGHVGGQPRIVLTTDGVHETLVAVNDPTPAGGTYFAFQGAHLNAWGEVAFFADYKPTPTTFSSGNFAGAPGEWRKAVAFNDPLPGGGECGGLAFSRNPMTPLDDAGNYLVWVRARFEGGVELEQLLVSRADGALETIASEGDAFPLGGTVGRIQAWPSLGGGAATLSAATPGGVLNTHAAIRSSLTWEDLGSSLAGSNGLPRLAGTGSLIVGDPGALRVVDALPLAPVFLLAGFSIVNQPFRGGTLVPSVDVAPLLFFSDPGGVLDLPWTSWPPGLPPCSEFVLQAWIVDAGGPFGAAASNGLLGRTP
ncbi:MAG: choice-of-anchor tandem repeat NxxGxxAF-containing protein [Planctomycetota bacterium]|jgi:hypothetical protein